MFCTRWCPAISALRQQLLDQLALIETQRQTIGRLHGRIGGLQRYNADLSRLYQDVQRELQAPSAEGLEGKEANLGRAEMTPG